VYKTFDDLVFIQNRPMMKGNSMAPPYLWHYDLATIHFENDYGVMIRDNSPNFHQERTVHAIVGCGYELTVIKYNTDNTFQRDYTVYPFGDVGRLNQEEITQMMQTIQQLPKP
jgi:hypothetical protein